MPASIFMSLNVEVFLPLTNPLFSGLKAQIVVDSRDIDICILIIQYFHIGQI